MTFRMHPTLPHSTKRSNINNNIIWYLNECNESTRANYKHQMGKHGPVKVSGERARPEKLSSLILDTAGIPSVLSVELFAQQPESSPTRFSDRDNPFPSQL